MKQISRQCSNANSYANCDKYVFDSSEEEEQWELHNKNFIKINKSVSMQNEHKIFPKALNTTTTKHNKKTQSFVMPPKPIKTNGTNGIKPKTKPKKKQHNNSLTLNQGNKNYKSSLNKTTTSANRSFKSNKTSKARSHLSRDYLIMNQTIYECENMEQVTEQLICGQPQFLTYGRYCKTVLKTMSKAQQYLLGFKQYIDYKKKTDLRLSKLTPDQKSKLYELLKNQNKTNKSSMEDIMKQAIENVEYRTQQIIKENEESKEEAIKWKNQKFHQLMAANNCLSHNFSDLTQSTISKDLQILLKETSSLQQPQTSIQRHPFENSSNNYSSQKYLRVEESKIEKRKNLQNGQVMMDTNIVGILKFMNEFFQFLFENQLINEVVEQLHERYGFNVENKHKIYALHPSQWNQFCYQKELPILTDESFISFSKQLAQKIDDQDSEHIHIFHKVLFDCANQLLVKYQPEYPFGSPHPFDLSQNLAFYIIDQDNFGCVWEEVVKQITNYSHTLMGLQIQQQKESRSELKVYEEKTFKSTIKNQIKKHEQDKIYSVAYGQMLYQIAYTIEEGLIEDFLLDVVRK